MGSLHDLVASVYFFALLGLIPAAIAAKKGRSFGKWWIYGTLLILVVLPHSLMVGSVKQCPFCAQLVKREATVCRYCSREMQKQAGK